MTPRQFQKYIDIFVKKEKTRAIESDLNNYNLGKYIAYAVNEPKKYPRKPFLYREIESLDQKKEKKVMTGVEMERLVRRNNIILGGKFKHGNS